MAAITKYLLKKSNAHDVSSVELALRKHAPRILAQSGTQAPQLANCHFMPPLQSRQQISAFVGHSHETLPKSSAQRQPQPNSVWLMATFTSRANEISENVNSPSDSVNRMAAPGSCLNPKYALPKPAIMRKQVDMPLATAQ